MKHEGWGVLNALGLELEERQLADLERYERLLVERAFPRGMVAASDMPRLRERHILDCLRAVPLLPAGQLSACDLGSGAGLPGIPLAIARSDVMVTLIEVRRTRAGFLEEAVAELALENVLIHPRRAETIRLTVDVCLARAFDKAPKAWEQAQRLLGPEGMLIYWAGASFEAGSDVPAGVRAELFASAALARSGPLAIMSRQ